MAKRVSYRLVIPRDLIKRVNAQVGTGSVELDFARNIGRSPTALGIGGQ